MNMPSRLPLALLPTPLHRLDATSTALDREVFIKRDDMTGSHLSGNKVRKLEFLLSRALEAGATHVITCGGLNSNHCRATALAAAAVGLEVVLLLRTPRGVPADIEGHTSFNMVLNQISGARRVLCDPKGYRARTQRMDLIAAEIEAEGGTAFVIPEGGSTALGSLGYVLAARELAEQAGPDVETTVVVAVGSGGTYAGLQVGLSIFFPAAHLIGIPVCDDADHFDRVAAEITEALHHEYGLALPRSGHSELVDGFQGQGYGITDNDGVTLLIDTARADGVLLDHVYSGKAFRGMVDLCERGDRRVKGRVIFIHTGGLFGLDAIAPRLARHGGAVT